MGVRFTPERLDPTIFAPQAPPAPGTGAEEEQPTARTPGGLRGAAAAREAEPANAPQNRRDAAEEEDEPVGLRAVEENAGTGPAGLQTALPGGNLDIVA